jgi:deferrochelatase/peroxidase EfeB
MPTTPFTSASLTAVGLDSNDIQGVLLRGYPNHRFSCHMLFQFKNSKANASAFIKAIIGYVQNATDWPEGQRPHSFIQLGLTSTGISTLKGGLNMANFPRAFTSGPASQDSQGSLKDNNPDSLPSRWTFGYGTNAVDCSVHVYADSQNALDALVNTISTAASSLTEIMPTTSGGRLYETQALQPNFIHFDYRDGIDNPDLDPSPQTPSTQSLNNFLIGYNPNPALTWPAPRGSGPEAAFAKNGFYHAFRVLFQDTVGFQNFLTAQETNVPATVTADKKEWLKAKMNGRWSEGSPIVLAPTANNPALETETVFDFSNDVPGSLCPYGAHTRITNPRNDNQVFAPKQPIIRLLRRGVPYGDPNPINQSDDGVDRGLVGIFLCGSLLDQFETMYGWLNQGSLLFSTPPYSVGQDPLVANYQYRPPSNKFVIPMDSNTANNVVLTMPASSFVSTRGTAYLLMPSLSALRSCFS